MTTALLILKPPCWRKQSINVSCCPVLLTSLGRSEMSLTIMTWYQWQLGPSSTCAEQSLEQSTGTRLNWASMVGSRCMGWTTGRPTLLLSTRSEFGVYNLIFSLIFQWHQFCSALPSSWCGMQPVHLKTLLHWFAHNYTTEFYSIILWCKFYFLHIIFRKDYAHDTCVIKRSKVST
jgi:hypothetical protein